MLRNKFEKNPENAKEDLIFGSEDGPGNEQKWLDVGVMADYYYIFE